MDKKWRVYAFFDNIFNRYDNLDGHLPESEITKTVPPKTKGFYTLKKYIDRITIYRYHFSSRVPGFVKMFLPTGIFN